MIALEPKRTALLVMDYQAEIISMFGDKLAPMLERAGTVVAAARKSDIPVIYVVVGFRPGYPEFSERNQSFAMITQSGRFLGSPAGADIPQQVRPTEREPIVVKHRVGAFGGTDLEILLRAKNIDTLVLFGISTSGVVLSTVRQGADSDYRLVVVKDCCADSDEEVHRVLTEKVFVRQTTVITAVEATEALETLRA